MKAVCNIRMITNILRESELVISMGVRRMGRLALLTVMCACFSAPIASADTVASLLGNFTINQYSELTLASDSVAVHYVVVYGQLPALRELHLADSNADGVTSQAERDAYVGRLAPGFSDALIVTVDGTRLELRPTRWTSSLPTEQGGFSLRVDVDLAGSLPGGSATQEIHFSNQNYAGRIGWHEIVVKAMSRVAVYDTNAYSTSATAGLTEALQSLPVNGPLDERSVHMKAGGFVPAGAVAIGARPDADLPAVKAQPAGSTLLPSSAAESEWISHKTRELVDAISSPTMQPLVALWALLAALALGAVHALSPGHGKTIVGAYLIGSRGTPRHAVFLGFTVTVTHTIGVFVVGFAALYASRFIVPEKLFPILSLISALLVLGMGLVLLVQRGRAARQALKPAMQEIEPVYFSVPTPTAADGSVRNYVFANAHAAVTSSPDGTMHSHGGGPMHSHLPPGARGEPVTWKSLLALGISGGLVPCPSAMVLLLAAIAINKTAFGMLLVLIFSVGLAITLTIIGLLFLYARNRFPAPKATARWPQVLPVLSALTITLLGIALCIGALRTFG